MDKNVLHFYVNGEIILYSRIKWDIHLKYIIVIVTI